MVYKSVFLRGFPDFFWNIVRYFIRNGTARLRCKDTTFDFGEMCIRRYSTLFDAFRCFSMLFDAIHSFSSFSSSQFSFQHVLKNIRLLLLLCRFVDLRHERVGVLADIVLGEHLLLLALLGPGLARGILLLPLGSRRLCLLGLRLLGSLLLLRALQTDGGLNVGGTELITFPSWQSASICTSYLSRRAQTSCRKALRRTSKSEKGTEISRPAISLVFSSFSFFSFSLRRGLGGRISFSVFRFLSFSLKFDEKKYFKLGERQAPWYVHKSGSE